MRIFAQDRAFYRKVRVDLGAHPEAARRFELLQRVERARGHGLTLAASLALLGLARSTCYDWRGRAWSTTCATRTGPFAWPPWAGSCSGALRPGASIPKGSAKPTPARSGARAAPRPGAGAASRTATPSAGAGRTGIGASRWTT